MNKVSPHVWLQLTLLIQVSSSDTVDTPTMPLKRQVERVEPKLFFSESREVPDSKAPVAVEEE